MSLYLKEGSLLLDGPGGSLADNADCCTCECICDTPKTVAPCECITEEYGAVQSVKSMQVIITGSMSSLGVGLACPDVSCPSINGTYVIACDTSKSYYIERFICTENFRDYYHVITLFIHWRRSGGWLGRIAVVSYVTSRFTGSPSSPDLQETTLFPPLFTRKQIRSVEYSSSAGGLDDWSYEPSVDCTEDCNIVIQNEECPVFDISPVDNTTVVIAEGCDVSTLGIAVSLI